MKSVDNPYSPGAGTPPPELAGRESILEQAENAIVRTLRGRAAKSLMLLGLRGVGKTVLLNRIDQIAEEVGCRTAIFEADPNRRLPEQITQQLHRILLRLDRRERVNEKVQRAFVLLRGFASAFRVKFGEFEVGLSGDVATGDLNIDLTDLLVAVGEAAESRNTVAVMMVDEVQYIAKRDLGALIMALHKISQRQLPVIFFGAGLPQLARLAGEAKSYAERLFDYPEVDRLDSVSARAALVEPAKRESVAFDEEALDAILKETEGYPFFLQVWGYYAWEAAPSSPITSKHVATATKNAITSLDGSFFRVRLDRLTTRQRNYARAMAEFGPVPAPSTAVAELLGLTVRQAASVREELMKRGTAYSPRRGLVAFTVPKFDEFMIRVIPKWSGYKR
jgi:hypothetical protein